MVFEFTVEPGFNFVKSFGEKFNIPVHKNSLKIPSHVGTGYIKWVDVEPGFKFALHHYTLKEDFYLKRQAPQEDNDVISIVFNSNEIPSGQTVDRETAIQFLKTNGSSIQIASAALATETHFPANIEVDFCVIGIRQPVLSLHPPAPQGKRPAGGHPIWQIKVFLS
jgi:hypothetical protein